MTIVVSPTVTEPNEIIAQDIWIPIICVFIANALLFVVAQFKKDNSIVDIMWGILFVIPNLIILIVSGNWNERTILTLSLISIWAIRLAVHIGIRHHGEDFRYQDMRKGWEAKGKCFYYFAAFTFVFMMQAAFSLIVNSSALYISIWSGPQFFFLDVIGAVIWLFGFVFEVVADWQLQ